MGTINLQLDVDRPEHRRALSAFLSALDGEKPAETPTVATSAAVADTSPETDTAPVSVPPPASSETETSASGSDESLPGNTDWDALDAKGTPYNDAIHTGTRSLNQDNTWRYKRGTDRAEAEALEAKLRQAVATSAAEPEAAPTPSMFAKPAPTPAPAPPAAADAPAQDFAALLRRIHAEGITAEARDAALTAAGLESLPQLAAQPDYVPVVWAQLFPQG